MTERPLTVALWVIQGGLVFAFASCVYRVFAYADMSWMPGCVFLPLAIIFVGGGLVEASR